MLKRKRFLSVLLSLVLILGMIPVTALAEQAESEGTGMGSHQTVSDVQALIDALPTAAELESMSQDEQAAVYEQVQAAYDAYNALTTDQQEQITGAEVINDLFAVFNGMATPAIVDSGFTSTTDTSSYTRTYTGGTGDAITIQATDQIDSVIFQVTDTLTVNNAISVDSMKIGITVTVQSGTVNAGSMALNLSNFTVNGGNLNVTGDITSAYPIRINGGNVSAGNIIINSNTSHGTVGVEITGGIVEVSGEISSAANGSGATSSVTVNGNAVVFANSIKNQNSDVTTFNKGVVFIDGTGEVYGSVTLPGDITIPEGYTLNIGNGDTLIVPQDTTITNYGTINVSGGTFTNSGTIENYGTINGNVGGSGSVKVPATVTMSAATGTYGGSVTLTATVKDSNGVAATSGTVYFYRGTDTSGSPLNSSGTNVNNGQATYNLTLNDASWTPSDTAYTITAVYTPASGSGLLGNSGTATLTVNAIPLDAPTGLAWSTTTPGQATWSTVTNASGYDLQLYKDGTAQGDPVTTSGTSYDFANIITQAGSYTFTVTATGSGAYSDSSASAQSAALYTVSFDTNGGTGTIPMQLVRNGSTATAPAVPTKTGHDFDGWYSDSSFAEGSKWTFATSTVTAATTLYAKWTASTYKVTLETNGGTVNNSNVTEYTYGVGATLPTNVTCAGYAFAGWYEDSAFTGNAVTAIDATETGDKTYYAKWLFTNAGITSVLVSGTTGKVNGSQISVVLPADTESLPTDSNKVLITLADRNAKVSDLAATDNGSTWTFTVTAEDGTTTASYTINVAIQISGTVAINGTPVCGQALTATYKGNADNVTYQWYRDNEEISNATSTTYTLTVEDVGHQLYVIATAADSIHTDYIMSASTTAIGPSYTVTIPEKVDLGGTVTISASDVNVASGQQLEVALTGTSGADNAFTLTNQEGAEIPYTVTAGNDPVSLNSTVLTVNGGEANAKGETSLTFVKPDEEEISFAGTYTGTMTFTIRTREVSGS